MAWITNTLLSNYAGELVFSAILTLALGIFSLGFLWGKFIGVAHRPNGLGQSIGRPTERMDGLANRMDESIARLTERMDGLAKRMDENIARLTGRVDYLFTAIPAASAPGSPLHLTDLGKRLKTEIQAQAILDRHRAEWRALLQHVPRTDESAMEKAALHIVKGDLKLTEDEENRIRQSADKARLPFEHVMTILAVMMRDELLASSAAG